MARRAYQGKDEEGIYTGKLPGTLGFLVVGLVADYDRREAEIRRGRLRRELLLKYDAINRTIDVAIGTVFRGESVEVRNAMRRDIAARRGYICCESKRFMAEGLFYRRKKWCKREIAERMLWI